ncbi:MAG: PEP-CTERM sorting domain-containing protein [Planctomycetota bacterium]
MKRLSILALCLGVVAVQAASARAVDIPFSFTAGGGAIPNIGGQTEGISVFALTMDPAHSDILPAPPYPMLAGITSLELQLTGLAHTSGGDLDIYLIDPFGKTLEIMTDRGNGFGINNATLIFNDTAAGPPPENGQIVSGSYLPEGVPGFSKYIGGSGGTDAWILVVIDDAAGDQGGLASFTLRGTVVPEPVTLSLLALGALVFLRRRRA